MVTCEICEQDVVITQIMTCPKANMVFHASHAENKKCPICGEKHGEKNKQEPHDARKK
jgi:hypothetical protein